MNLKFKLLGRIVFLGLLVSAIVLSGCKKEEVFPDPEITFIEGEGYVYTDTTIGLNERFTIGLEMTSRSDEDITHFNKTVVRDGVTTSIDTALAAKELELGVVIDKSLAASEIWSFYCRDRDSRKSETISLTISLDTTSVYSGIKYIPSLVLGAQNNENNGSFLSLSDEKVLNLTEAFIDQDNVDLAYYYDTEESDKNTIASPGANISELIFSGNNSLNNWTIKNTTRFVQASISLDEFERCKNDSLILANTFDFSSGKRKAKKLAADQVYSFVTESGLKGLFLVEEVIAQAEGSIKISLKILD